MSNEIVSTTPTTVYALAELREIADAFVKCGFYGFRDPSQALVLMLQARADGVDPMTAAAQYSIIQGRPALKSEAILVRFQAAGGLIKWKKREDESCTLWLSHPKGGELEVTWDRKRAEKAGLWGKDNFKKHPAQMLAARCISEGVRALFPACLSGCYTPEEAVFFNDEKPVASAPHQHINAQPSVGPNDPVNEALDAVEKTAKAKPSAKKAKAVEAEVIAANDPEEIMAQPEDVKPEDAQEIDEKTVGFISYMETLRKSNAAVFDHVWAENYVKAYGCDFKKVEPENRQAVYTYLKAEISKAAAENIGEYLH